jgi:uroporphyrinogen decarboxylase
MKPFDEKFTEIATFANSGRKPDFNNILKVLRREEPDRPTLFEFFLNDGLHDRLTVGIPYDVYDPDLRTKKMIDAYRIASYDYVTIIGSDFGFHSDRHAAKTGEKSLSLNEGAVITNRKSFEAYNWPDPATCNYSVLDRLAGYLPEDMKFIVWGSGGVLENVTTLLGFENMCLMSYDNPALLQDTFDAVGSRFVEYYRRCAAYPSVGALISNDDWGFNSQTMMSTADMRKYVIPWHKKIAETIHAAGKPAILHSCGNLVTVMDDIIDVIGFDAKHSYEDKIMPVEQAYDKYSGRIAILGGLDVDYVCRSTPEEVYNRAAAMLERAKIKGGYALGTGNSIPTYVPQCNYLAMIAAAVFN